MTEQCNHKFVAVGRCRQNVCVLCGDKEPRKEYDPEILIDGKKLMKDYYTVKDGVIIFKEPFI